MKVCADLTATVTVAVTVTVATAVSSISNTETFQMVLDAQHTFSISSEGMRERENACVCVPRNHFLLFFI